MDKSDKFSFEIIFEWALGNKKAVFAVCLLFVMGFMWLRILRGGGAEVSEAAAIVVGAGELKAKKVEISYVDMPVIEGRNDRLSRNIFKVNDWSRFFEGVLETSTETDVVKIKDGVEDDVKKISSKLKLEAIGTGGHPEAFINGKLLSEGDRFTVPDGAGLINCEVLRIDEKEVVIGSGDCEISLKLEEFSGVVD